MVFPTSAALLDACLLAVLAKGDTYGYALTQQIKEKLGVSESTLYPVLRRLQREAFLTAYDQPFDGRNRRYYQITPEGERQLAWYREEWKTYRSGIDSILLTDTERNGDKDE